ncbi:MAG: AAA family ATPase, partial [bacterium]
MCKACGAVQTRWMGKCPDCNTWESLEQQTVERAKVDPRNAAASQWAAAAAQSAEADGGDGPDGDGAGAGGGIGAGVTAGLEALGSGRTPARPIAEVGTAGPPVRIMTGIGELDRVLGGGVVPGSAVLLGGDPGIGKSTLLLQAAGSLARGGVRTLYVSSEESAEQVKLRFARLVSRADGTRASTLPELFVLADTSLGRIAEQAAKVLGEVPTERRLLVIDSIQMVYKADLDAFPGSMTQLRRCCAELVYMAKATGTAV